APAAPVGGPPGRGPMSRRAVLALGGAAGALGLGALFAGRPLARDARARLRTTAWRPGARLVGPGGQALRVNSLLVGEMVTVFPEGGPRRADSQVVLVRVAAERVRARRDRVSWSPAGNIAFSAVCTHTGCPVGSYQAEAGHLLCPCHQSVFDVLDGARPLSGPAARALPQLPLAVDDGGYLVAVADFDEPVGPHFWGRR
ncbi:MAG: Rieske (2Fe-2S) protein, partial [Actinomycetota bacterium]